MHDVLTHMKKENKAEKILFFIFILMFAAQFIALVYFNITQLKYHLGYDISSNYLRAIEMVKQHKLLPDHWAYTTARTVISTTAVAALFYGLINDIYVAFGLANLLIMIVTLAVLWKILSMLKFSYVTRFAGLNFYLCPFITTEYNNACDLGYASNMLLGAGFYSMIILMILLCMLHLLVRRKTIFPTVCGALLSALLTVMAVTSGLFVWSTFLVAGLLYYIVIAIWRNDKSYLKHYNFQFYLWNSFFSLAAKLVAGNIFNFKTHDSKLTFITAGNFFDNIGNIFEGFIQFLGGLPYSEYVPAMGKTGICYMMGWIVIGMFFLAAVWAVRYANKEKDHWRNFLLFILLENIGLFSVCKVTYGAEIFENRYLLVMLFSILCILLSYLDFLRNNQAMRTVFAGAFLMAILVLDVSGDDKYLNTKNDYQYLNQVVAALEEFPVPVVYAYGSDVFNDVRNLRVIDQSKIYKTIARYNYYAPWGDYTYYQDNYEYHGENCLITTEEDFKRLPDFIKKDYSLISSIDKYDIYHSNVSKFDLSSSLGQHTIDFPYSYGFETRNGRFDDEGQWITNGTEGHCLYGPYCNTKQGIYNVILKYKILENGERSNVFDIAVNHGEQILSSVELKNTEQSAEICGLELQDGDTLEYRVFNAKESIMEVSSIEVIRQ